MKISNLQFLLVIFWSLCLTAPAQIVINEYSVSNLSGFADNYGKFEDWIELYNSSGSTVNLGGYYLSDNPANPTKWQIPEGITIAGQGFLKIWASGRNLVSGVNIHTNFRLTQTKDTPEQLVFSDPSGTLLDSRALEITQKEHSRGRKPNGSDTWGIFTNPTPGSSNNSQTLYTAYAAKPVMSDSAGFYSVSITVSISTPEPESIIRFTTDGTQTSSSSPVYSSPINVNSTTIIIARTYSNNSSILPSLLEFNTYFIGVTHNLGVVSASSEQLDNLLNGNASLRPFGTFEYFNADGIRTTRGYGEYNEHGQDSWVHPQRSIDYITRDECGYNYAIRDAIIPITERDEFQRIILRAAGDDNYPGIDTSAHLRDYFIENTATKGALNLDCRKGQKGSLYVNGIYWGVYGYREKVNDHDYTEYYYNQGKYDIYYLMLWGGSWAEYGGQAAWNDWNSLHDFIKFNDMSNQDNYEYVKTRLDVTSLVDYILINSFVVCSDWINWNVGWWRGTNPNGGHQRWGYTLWDEDATFNHYINYTGVPGTQPTVSPCFPEGLTADPEEHIVMLNHLLDNAEFYRYYVSRYIDLYNTIFRPERMIAYLDSIEAEMLPEMSLHVDRWGGSLQQWQNNVQKIRNFINVRHAYLPTGLKNCYNLTGPYEFNVMIDPPGAGHIRINSLIISQEQGWGGYYFGGIDTELEAIEISPQYTFDHWELFNHVLSPSDTSKNVTISLTTNDFVKAVFSPVPIVDSLIINEIMYNADTLYDTEDWVEFYNPHNYPLDISGWEFRDDNDAHIFEFPPATVIAAEGFLVLCRDSAAFHSFYPEVDNYLGEMGFGLSSGGELIRLFNADGLLVDTVHYDNNEPWPPEPDGEGPSLELKHWSYDNALPESWAASAGIGTPGAPNGYVVSTNEAQMANPLSFTIYPNPAINEANLQVTSRGVLQNGLLRVYNSYGNEVLVISNIGKNHLVLDCSQLPSGIYIAALTDQDTKQTKISKFMIK